MSTEAEIFVVFHKDCRHVAAIHNKRADAERVAANLWPRQSDWAVRSGEDGDIHALLRGDKCLRCDQASVMP